MTGSLTTTLSVLLLLIILSSSSVATGPSTTTSPPRPPARTPAQAAFLRRVSSEARVASAAATATLLALLASDAVRAELRALGAHALAATPAPALLAAYRAEVGVAEVAHGFPARFNASGVNGLDFGLDLVNATTWFPNQWQLPLLDPARETAAYFELLSFLAPAAATEVRRLYGADDDFLWGTLHCGETMAHGFRYVRS